MILCIWIAVILHFAGYSLLWIITVRAIHRARALYASRAHRCPSWFHFLGKPRHTAHLVLFMAASIELMLVIYFFQNGNRFHGRVLAAQEVNAQPAEVLQKP